MSETAALLTHIQTENLIEELLNYFILHQYPEQDDKEIRYKITEIERAVTRKVLQQFTFELNEQIAFLHTLQLETEVEEVFRQLATAQHKKMESIANKHYEHAAQLRDIHHQLIQKISTKITYDELKTKGAKHLTTLKHKVQLFHLLNTIAPQRTELREFWQL